MRDCALAPSCLAAYGGADACAAAYGARGPTAAGPLAPSTGPLTAGAAVFAARRAACSSSSESVKSRLASESDESLASALCLPLAAALPAPPAFARAARLPMAPFAAFAAVAVGSSPQPKAPPTADDLAGLCSARAVLFWLAPGVAGFTPSALSAFLADAHPSCFLPAPRSPAQFQLPAAPPGLPPAGLLPFSEPAALPPAGGPPAPNRSGLGSGISSMFADLNPLDLNPPSLLSQAQIIGL